MLLFSCEDVVVFKQYVPIGILYIIICNCSLVSLCERERESVCVCVCVYIILCPLFLLLFLFAAMLYNIEAVHWHCSVVESALDMSV